MNSSWLQYDSCSNRISSTYLQGFLDISGNIILRNGGINITNGDISLNGNLFVKNINTDILTVNGAILFPDNSMVLHNSYCLDYVKHFGSNWTTQSSSILSYNKISVSATGRFQAASVYSSFIRVSADYGGSWTNSASSQNWRSVAISGTGKYQVACGNGMTSIYLSSNYGNGAWNTSSSYTAGSDSFDIAISTTGQYISYILQDNVSSTTYYIVISSDYGQSWGTIATAGRTFTNITLRGITISNTGQYQYACSYNGYIYGSSNYGVSWSQLYNISGNNYFWKIATSASGKYVTAVVGGDTTSNNGYIYTSSNYGVSWQYSTTTGSRNWQCICISDNGKYQMAGYNSGYLYISKDYGVTWYESQNTLSMYWASISMSGNAQYIAGVKNGAGNIYRSQSMYNDVYLTDTFTKTTDISINGLSFGYGPGGATQNVIFGVDALKKNVLAGSNIIAIGSGAAASTVTTGGGFVAVGADSNITTSTGVGESNCIGANSECVGNYSNAIGYNAKITGTSANLNSSALGYGTIISAPHIVRLGNTSITMVDTSGSINTWKSIKNGYGTLDSFIDGSGHGFCSENTVYSIPIGAAVTDRFWGGVLAPNGNIYCIPNTGTVVGVINPVTNSYTTFGSVTGASKYAGGIVAPNGDIYCIPYTATNVGIINPTAHTINITTITGITGTSKYVGGVLASNGNIYCIPWSAANIGIINPNTNTFSSFSITVTGTIKFGGGVLAPNGKIYCIPMAATVVGIIDPTTNTIDVTTITGIAGTNKFIGGVLAPNGNIYCIPYTVATTTVGVINTTNNTYSTISDATLLSAGGYAGGVLGQDGLIYCMSNRTANNSILVIDPNTNTILSKVGTFTGTSPYFVGGVLAPNGNIYCIPGSLPSIGVITTRIPTEEPWMLAPEFNKF